MASTSKTTSTASSSTSSASVHEPTGRSGCPINQAVEVIGDHWCLVVLRDVMFGPSRHFSALHQGSIEGIATNVLANRLDRLVAAGLLTRHPDPDHRQRVNYRLTEAAIELVPVMATLGAWGVRWRPTSPELAVRAELLADGGSQMWNRFMDELRAEHLDGEQPVGDSVTARLDAAYEVAVGTG